MMNIPVYRYPWSYACENGEETEFRLSLKANIACKEAIETAIADHTTAAKSYGVEFNAAKAAAEVVTQFALERTSYVIANTLRFKDWDGRYSPANKAWAKTVPCFSDETGIDDTSRRFVVDKPHPVLIDAFTAKIRELSEGSRTLKK